MFGEYLKKVRHSLNLTQKELAIKLNLADEEFESLDVVTLSRWERGKTKPPLVKCLRILRCLQLDLSDFYNLIPNPNETQLTNEFFRIRFDNALIRVSSSNYELATKPLPQLIIEQPLLNEDNDRILDNLKAFYENADYVPRGLFNISLYDYHKNRRAMCKKFTTKDGKLIGHSISFLFEEEYFDSSIHSKKLKIDLTKATNYRVGTKFAVCNYNRYASNIDVFRCMFVSQCINLLKYSNLHRYYFLNIIPEGGRYLELLGFNKVAFDIESDNGEFNLGDRLFERCLYEIDASKLLSHPEIITLIKTTQWDKNH